MREIGASDAFIYMTNTGVGNTMEIQIDMTFVQPADPAALQLAADRALALFPEFSARLVTRNGHLMYQEDEEPVRIIETDDPAMLSVNYCTGDTNGHVWYLSLDSRDRRLVTFSCLHGMSDFAGCMMLLRTLLWEYRLILEPENNTSSEQLASAGIRTAVPDDWSLPEKLDPYGFCAEKIAFSAPFASPEIPFAIQGLPLFAPTSDVNHIWHVTTDSKAFLAKCRELGTSFAPLIIDTLIDTVSGCFHPGNETVTAGLPIDMRPIFGVNPITNFSDAVLLGLTSEQRKLPVRERCALLKQAIGFQRTAEHMGPAVKGKAQSAKAMLDDPAGFVQVAERLMAPILSGTPRKSPLTFMVTYPGRTDLPAPLEGLIQHILPESVMGKVKFYFLISTHGSVMTLQVVQRYEGDALPRMLAGKLKTLGLEAEVADLGLRRQGYLLPEKLDSIN